MLSMASRKACPLIAFLLICVTVGAVIACQVHITPLGHEHAVPSKSHSSSSTHASLDFSCMGMAAVLTIIVLVAFFVFHTLQVTPSMLKYTILAFPPFIPPRSITHSVFVA